MKFLPLPIAPRLIKISLQGSITRQYPQKLLAGPAAPFGRTSFCTSTSLRNSALSIMKALPYGTWPSPITAESIVKGVNRALELVVDDVTGDLFKVEARPSEKGRCVLVNAVTLKDVVPAGFNVRTGVHEYGGGVAVAHNGIIYFSHLVDGRIYQTKSDGSGSPTPITPDKLPYRYSDFRVHPTQPNFLVSVLEDHTHDHHTTIVNTLCSIDIQTSTVHPLKGGADFYASPRFSPDGKHLVWQEWYHPDMPWEGAEIHVAEISYDASSSTLKLGSERVIAGKRMDISAGYPEWISNDAISFDTDETGYQNPYIYTLGTGKTKSVFPSAIKEDFQSPAWVLGCSRRVVLPDGKYGIFSSFKDGRSTMYLADLTTKKPPVFLENPFVTVEQLLAVPGKSEIAFIAAQADKSGSVYKATVNIASNKLKATDLTDAPSKHPTSYVSIPVPYSIALEELDGPIHVVYYPPTNPEYVGLEETKPPCIVSVHGGPTAISEQGLTWEKQFFTSRGFAWLDVNYRGSSGYGRAYMMKLSGTWGIVDVRDTILAAWILSSPKYQYNLTDPDHLFIRGGSSGGYTVLVACSCPPASSLLKEDQGKVNPATVFAAGTSKYGIGDLSALILDTHKFESQYMNKLLLGSDVSKGGVDVEVVAKERSPINYVDKIERPLLLLQGSIDRVVPPEQSRTIYDAIKSRGGKAEFVLYEGEGHGFRQEENVKDALEREVKFYQSFLTKNP